LVAAQPLPQRDDISVIGRSFMAAIIAEVFAAAVAIVLAIGEVVFCIVGKEIGQRETVMHRDVVDGGAWRGGTFRATVTRPPQPLLCG